MEQARAQGRGLLGMLIRTKFDAMVFQDGFEPDHDPVNISAIFDLGCKELKQFEQEHLWHVSHDQRYRCDRDAPVYSIGHLS